MPVETKLMMICLLLLAFGLVYGVLKVIGAWYDHHVSRHDLIAESKRRRLEYLQAIADRDREIAEAQAAEAHDSVVIEDEAPEFAQAA